MKITIKSQKEPQGNVLVKKTHSLIQPGKGIIKFFNRLENIPILGEEYNQFIGGLVYSLKQIEENQHKINTIGTALVGLYVQITQFTLQSSSDVLKKVKKLSDTIDFVYLKINLNSNYINISQASINLGRQLQCNGIIPVFGLYLQYNHDLNLVQTIYNNFVMLIGSKKLFYEGLLIEVGFIQNQQNQVAKMITILRRTISTLIGALLIRVEGNNKKEIFNLHFVKNRKVSWIIEYSVQINQKIPSLEEIEGYALECMGIQ